MKKEVNSNQINNTSYYQLPCGSFLEDFIWEKNLNFNMGSALKYEWRAGKKDGESKTKDHNKADHYVAFEAECRYLPVSDIREELAALLDGAKNWDGMKIRVKSGKPQSL